MRVTSVLRRSILLLAIALAMSCARRPEVKREPEPKPAPPPVAPGFIPKSYQISMRDEMERSYAQADEVMVAVLAGINEDPKKGSVYYFEDFKIFNKPSLSWGPALDVLVEVRPGSFKPELIRRDEFKRLIALDRVGICWDFDKGKRFIYLVEGQRNLIFLKVELEESTSRAYRYLLDAYPVTRECGSVDVFHLMLRRQFVSSLDRFPSL